MHDINELTLLTAYSCYFYLEELQLLLLEFWHQLGSWQLAVPTFWRWLSFVWRVQVFSLASASAPVLSMSAWARVLSPLAFLSFLSLLPLRTFVTSLECHHHHHRRRSTLLTLSSERERILWLPVWNDKVLIQFRSKFRTSVVFKWWKCIRLSNVRIKDSHSKTQKPTTLLGIL